MNDASAALARLASRLLLFGVGAVLSACATIMAPNAPQRSDLVTNAEFKRFVDDGGYGRRELWSEPGWRWRTKGRLSGPRPAHGVARRGGDADPMTGVSWYEADAFCRFVGRQLPAVEPARFAALVAEAPPPSPRASPARDPVPLESPHAYVGSVRDAIRLKWSYPCVQEATGCDYKEAFLVALFGIFKSGNLGYFDVVSSSGYRVMDEHAAEAVKRAAPFAPVRTSSARAASRSSRPSATSCKKRVPLVGSGWVRDWTVGSSGSFVSGPPVCTSSCSDPPAGCGSFRRGWARRWWGFDAPGGSPYFSAYGLIGVPTARTTGSGGATSRNA